MLLIFGHLSYEHLLNKQDDHSIEIIKDKKFYLT